MENDNYEMAQRLKRMRRAALKEAAESFKSGGPHRNKSRYSRKSKHKVDYAQA